MGSASGQQTELQVGKTLKLDGEVFIVQKYEKTKVVRRADHKSGAWYEQALRARQINRYMPGYPQVEPHEDGDMIVEEWECLHLKSRAKHWTVYLTYIVRKETNDHE